MTAVGASDTQKSENVLTSSCEATPDSQKWTDAVADYDTLTSLTRHFCHMPSVTELTSPLWSSLTSATGGQGDANLRSITYGTEIRLSHKVNKGLSGEIVRLSDQ